MKNNSKRRCPFVLVKYDENSNQTIFVSLLQTPKVPDFYAWKWALKKVRDWLRKENIPFKEWGSYELYPVHRFNCCQFDWKKEDVFYDHIHVADSDEQDDKETMDFYNRGRKSKYNCKVR